MCLCPESSSGEERPSSAPGGHQTNLSCPLPIHPVSAQPGDAAHPGLPRSGLHHQGLTSLKSCFNSQNSVKRPLCSIDRRRHVSPSCYQSMFRSFCLQPVRCLPAWTVEQTETLVSVCLTFRETPEDHSRERTRPEDSSVLESSFTVPLFLLR